MIDYTDPDTIARQNIAPNAGCNIDEKFYDVRNLVHLASSQADRIEELTKERDSLLAGHRALNIGGARLQDRAEAAEAKLEKAVEALEDIVKDCEADYPPSHVAIKYFAMGVLAEIKAESHD